MSEILSGADIIQIIEVCARSKVRKFSHKMFSMEFGAETANQSTVEDVKESSLPLPKSQFVDEQSFMKQFEHGAKSDQLELMAIENPELYETLLGEGELSEGDTNAEFERSGSEPII